MNHSCGGSIPCAERAQRGEYVKECERGGVLLFYFPICPMQEREREREIAPLSGEAHTSTLLWVFALQRIARSYFVFCNDTDFLESVCGFLRSSDTDVDSVVPLRSSRALAPITGAVIFISAARTAKLFEVESFLSSRTPMEGDVMDKLEDMASVCEFDPITGDIPATKVEITVSCRYRVKSPLTHLSLFDWRIQSNLT